MWQKMRDIFPIYRSLLGPGYTESLEKLCSNTPMKTLQYPSGMQCFDWTIPKEFKVNQSFVIDPYGNKILDFEESNHHVWIYSQPFHGEVTKKELLDHIAVSEEMEDAIPLKPTYYRKKWGLSASKKEIEHLPNGNYKVHINTEHYNGFLRMGEWFLPGDTDEEVMITGYLCHPGGANDNLSGCILAVELFKLLNHMPRRRYSYRLVIFPETIGSITYIYHHQKELKRVIGGLVATCVGDPGCFHYKKTFHGDALIDRAVLHVLSHNVKTFNTIEYSHSSGSDEVQFNSIGLRIPFGSIMKTPYGQFPQYHTNLDNLSFVTKEALFETLNIYWLTIQALERNKKYKGHYTVDPFMTKYGIYPFEHGAGEGSLGNEIARAYYELMGYADGKHDMISIANKSNLSIFNFDNAVTDFKKAGLIKEVK